MAQHNCNTKNAESDDDFKQNNYFEDSTEEDSSFPSLNLTNLYILTTNRSASASELLINGLAPHINVIQIGGTTVGKNVGSISVYDYIDNNGTKNPNHTYAMQPIVLKIANSVGFADYTEGLIPDIAQVESSTNLGVLGDPTEPFLATALNQISGSAKYSSPEGDDGIHMKDPIF